MSATFSCTVNSTDYSASLGMEIWFDDQCIFDCNHLDKSTNINWEFDDSTDGSHELRFIMKNKTNEHTKVDKNGEIISDACVTVSNVAFDGIELGHTLTKEAEYAHDFNGTQEPIRESFYGTMGCNGVVSLRFTTPIYLWFLEHM